MRRAAFARWAIAGLALSVLVGVGIWERGGHRAPAAPTAPVPGVRPTAATTSSAPGAGPTPVSQVASGAQTASSTTPAAPTSTTPPVPRLLPVWGAGGYRNEVIVLMYHRFLSKVEPGDDITPANLATQLALFHQDGYHAISLAQFIAFVNGTGTVPPNALLLTFDNGYQSQYTDVFPLLKKYRDPATFFLIASWLSPGYSPPGIHPLTAGEIRRMVASGLVTVATQGWNVHRAVLVSPGHTEAADIGRAYNPATQTQESLASYQTGVEADLLHAQRALLPLAGRSLDAYAYPFGDYDPQLIALLHQAGFHYLFTAKLGWGNLQGQSPNVLFRLNVGSDHTTPAGALSAIRTVARDTAQDPGWQPPAQKIEVWR